MELEIIIGQRASGKTSLLKKEMESIKRKRNILFFDINSEHKGLKRLPIKNVSEFSKGKFDVKRIVPNKRSLKSVVRLAKKIYQNFDGGVLIFDDICSFDTSYPNTEVQQLIIKDLTYPDKLKNIKSKTKVVLVYQSISKVPFILLDNCNKITLHDDIYDRPFLRIKDIIQIGRFIVKDKNTLGNDRFFD